MIPRKIQFCLYIIFIFVAFFACQKKKKLAVKILKNKNQTEEIIRKADLFYKNKQLDSAFYFYNKARASCNMKEDAKNYVYCMYYMAEIQQYHEDFIGSTKTANETIPYLNQIKDANYVWNIYSVLGRNYFYTYDYPNAIYYYSKAFTLKTDKINKLEAKNNIAVIYIKQQKFDKALPIFLSISKEKIVQQSHSNYSKIIDYIGYCHFKLKNYTEALSFFEMSLKINSRSNNTNGLGRTYYNLTEFYQNKKADLAIKYAKLSYENYKSSGNVEGQLLALKFIIEKTNSALESKKNALTYTKLTDSIYEARQRAKNHFAKIKYDTKNEKEENLKLKAQKIKNELLLAKQQSRNIVSYIIIILAVFLIVFLYSFLTFRANRQKIEATYQSETRISKKLHDELANDIYHAMAFVENKDLSFEENQNHLLKRLEDIYSRTRNISNKNAPIIINQNYTDSLKELISGFDTPAINLLINGLDTISWDYIDKIKKVAVYRSIQELLVNMKKHSNASLVAITFKEVDEFVMINYTDNGKGIDINKMVLKNGLHNIENRIYAIKGDIAIQSDFGEGFKVHIKFPA